jgi:hypothetical protein
MGNGGGSFRQCQVVVPNDSSSGIVVLLTWNRLIGGKLDNDIRRRISQNATADIKSLSASLECTPESVACPKGGGGEDNGNDAHQKFLIVISRL